MMKNHLKYMVQGLLRLLYGLDDKSKDHIERGKRGFSLGNVIFGPIRLLLSTTACMFVLLWDSSEATFGNISLKQQLYLVLIVTAALRHLFWSVYLTPSPLSVRFSIVVALYNAVVDALWLWFGSKNDDIGVMQVVAVCMFIVGSLIETVSELQRKIFKDKSPKRTLFTGGLFKYAQHINYMGYSMWRLALGLYNGVLPMLLSTHNFVQFLVVSVDNLQIYLNERYREQKLHYDKVTPYKLLPGIW